MDKVPVIQVKHLCKIFTRTVKAEEEKKKSIKSLGKLRTKTEDFLAVNDISFSAYQGEVYGILGPNGAGKTTLLRMLGGILTPTSGTIKVMEYDYETQRELAKKKIGYLSGNTKLYGRLSPRELFRTFGELYELSKE